MDSVKNTVLLVDDDENLIRGLLRHLRHEPYRTLSAFSAQEALRVLEEEPVDVVITDERMPNMTGAELVSQVRKKHSDIICMILSGQTDFDAAVRAINEGQIYRFLRKPCDPMDIAASIRLALEHQNLIIQFRRLQDQYEEKLSYIKKLEQEYPGILDLQSDKKGRILL